MKNQPLKNIKTLSKYSIVSIVKFSGTNFYVFATLKDKSWCSSQASGLSSSFFAIANIHSAKFPVLFSINKVLDTLAFLIIPI